MSLLRNYSISARVGILTAMFVLLGSTLAGYTYYKEQESAQNTTLATQVLTPQLSRINAMYLTLTRISLQSRHAILARTPKELDDTLRDIEALSSNLDRLSAEFERHLDTPKEHELFARVKERRADFWKAAITVIELVKADKRQAAFAQLVDQVIPARNVWLQTMEAQRQFQEQHLVQTMDHVREDTAMVRATLIALIVFLIVSGLTQFFLSRHLIRARAAQAQEQAERVASGDLSVIEADTHRDEFSGLMASLHNMRDNLARLIADIRNSVDSVATGSQEIASGNQDLSTRTEQQAVNLQHAASSMEQLTGTVRQNLEAAQQANQLASTASQVATRGGQTMSQVVNTMQGITESSRKIEEIISVIDGIAFQTNILALNAAVEAARAGEQGRGFAVVAGEVRNLAQRSAQAAQEIKGLISNSVQKVEDGARQVNNAGSTMNEIVTQVRRVTDLIAEITAATSEQSNGIGLVSQTVNQLDQTTQQNAALVEQTAAASSSLSEQSDRLSQAVSMFKLSRQ